MYMIICWYWYDVDRVISAMSQSILSYPIHHQMIHNPRVSSSGGMIKLTVLPMVVNRRDVIMPLYTILFNWIAATKQLMTVTCIIIIVTMIAIIMINGIPDEDNFFPSLGSSILLLGTNTGCCRCCLAVAGKEATASVLA